MIEEQRHSLVGLALAVAVGIVLGGLAIAAVFAVLAAVIHLLGWLVQLAVVVALIAGVWWLAFGRRHNRAGC